VDEARAFLLTNLIKTYLPLSVEEREAVRVQLGQGGDKMIEATELTWAEQILQEGVEQGRQEGLQALRETARGVVRARFGKVTPDVETMLAAMTRIDNLSTFINRAVVASDEASLLS